VIRIAMIAITTSSSIRVNALRRPEERNFMTTALSEKERKRRRSC
jgi:hypothetical protein